MTADTLMSRGPGGEVVETTWPDAEFINGNPPFLRSRLLRRNLDSDYVDDPFVSFGTGQFGDARKEAALLTDYLVGDVTEWSEPDIDTEDPRALAEVKGDGATAAAIRGDVSRIRR